MEMQTREWLKHCVQIQERREWSRSHHHFSGTLMAILQRKATMYVIQKPSGPHGMCWVFAHRAALTRDLARLEACFPLWI